MRQIRKLGVMLVWLAAVPAATAKTTEHRELSAAHRKWLDHHVTAIISNEERQGFLELADDARRDVFIDAFWKVRDPTPGTDRNEFRSTHFERLAEADQMFRRGKRPGSTTPRGRLYVQLGAPAARERHSYGRVYPTELWVYRGDSRMGLPPMFQLLFYRPYGAGGFELYDPSFDGPEKLVGGLGDPRLAPGASERTHALRELRGINPNLARASLSHSLTGPIGGNGGMILGSSLLTGRLASLNEHMPVDRSYVDKVRRGEPLVRVAYQFGRIAMTGQFHGAFAADGTGVVHFALEIPPAQLTLIEHGRRFTGQLEVTGSVRDTSGRNVTEIDQVVDIDISRKQLDQVEAHPLAFEHKVALAPGRYQAMLVVRNPITGEVGIIEQDFVVPERPERGVAFGAIVISDSTIASDGSDAPFTFAGRLIYPRRRLHATDDLVALFQVATPSNGSEISSLSVDWSLGAAHEDSALRTGSVELERSFGNVAVGRVQASLSGLPPGSYQLRIVASGGEERASFDIVAGLPWTAPFIYYGKERNGDATPLVIAERQLAVGDEVAAIATLEAAVLVDHLEIVARLRLAELRLRRKQPAPRSS